MRDIIAKFIEYQFSPLGISVWLGTFAVTFVAQIVLAAAYGDGESSEAVNAELARTAERNVDGIEWHVASNGVSYARDGHRTLAYVCDEQEYAGLVLHIEEAESYLPNVYLRAKAQEVVDKTACKDGDAR